MHRFQFQFAYIVLGILLFNGAALGVPKPHVVNFGKWIPIKWCVGSEESKCIDLKIRNLYVDGRMKEFTLGAPHEISERLFVVRRVFRLNDSLPSDTASPPRWQWQRGGWLLVDRVTGHVSAISLPEFDSYYSVASWYRDYAAYCGVSDDGKKLFAVVFQVGRRKPVLKKALGDYCRRRYAGFRMSGAGVGAAAGASHLRGRRESEINILGARTCGGFGK
jgi:hypothetical protein